MIVNLTCYRLFVYPFTGYGGITVSKADEARLDDGEFLNDSIIDFYMKWLVYDPCVP